MKKKYVRVGFTPAQKKELWERWRRGEQMKSIGRELCKPASSIFNHIRSTGGFTPIPRRRVPAVLSLAEREEISRGLMAGSRLDLLPGFKSARRARLVVKLLAMTALRATELSRLTSELGNRPYGPSPASW